MTDLRQKILDQLQWYGEQFDPHGWEVAERIVATDAILALFVDRLKLLQDSLPDEKVGTENMPLDQAERSYNIAIQDVKAILSKAMGDLK